MVFNAAFSNISVISWRPVLLVEETRVPGENYLNVWNVSDPIVEVNAVVLTSVSRGSLYEQFGNKCVKILKFWRTELSYAQNKNRGKKMRLLGMDTCPSLNDIMEIRCNK